MNNLDDAMLERMTYIVKYEHRPFSYIDFLDLMKPKTFRNKILELKKKEVVELDYKSSVAFYTLKGHSFGKAGTPNHTGVCISYNDPVYQMIKNLPMDRQAIHDIRCKFQAPDIYEAFSHPTTPSPFLFPKDDVNCDIRLPYWNVNKAVVQVRIHKTNTVSVIIACSLEPFSFDYNGIIRFFTTLSSVWGLLVGLTIHMEQSIHIQHYGNWLITMWHFGRDALTTYKGEKYEITVEKAEHIFTRLYAKDFGKYSKIRLERVECPRTTVFEAMEEKLKLDSSSASDRLEEGDLSSK